MEQHLMQQTPPLVELSNVSKTFILGKSIIRQALGKKPGYLHAVHRVSLSIYPGECVGLVGESGCGKSTLGKCILRLVEPDEGEVIVNGDDFLKAKRDHIKLFRSKMQMVFQDPYSSLNPSQKISSILAEVTEVFHTVQKDQINQRIDYLLNIVGLGSEIKNRYPSELSGGQRQRVGMARALAVNPDFIIADEPVSSLDVSIQAQVINLLVELQEKLDLSMLFITHDLRVVRYVSHRVAVMYLGCLVELAPTEYLFENPLHPYTQALLKAAPEIDPRKIKEAVAITGEPPNPINISHDRCVFHGRCPYAFDRCLNEFPNMIEVKTGHFVACHLMNKLRD